MTAPPQGVEVDHIEFPAGKIRYHQAGTSGPAIVLLHGEGLDNGLLSWRHTIPVLAADHRVFVPDLPGQGGSHPWVGRASQRTFEEVVRWLLDSWQVRAATLVGLSVGASVAAGFALRHPQRVSGLVLVGADGMRHRLPNHLLRYLLVRLPLAGQLTAGLLGRSRGLVRSTLTRKVFTGGQPVSDLESIVDEVAEEARHHSSVFTDWQRESVGRTNMKVNHLPNLNRIHCPTVVIHGEQDQVVPPTVAREIAGAIPGSSLRLLPSTGHWPNREKPNEFNALLREFVNHQR